MSLAFCLSSSLLSPVPVKSDRPSSRWLRLWTRGSFFCAAQVWDKLQSLLAILFLKRNNGPHPLVHNGGALTPASGILKTKNGTHSPRALKAGPSRDSVHTTQCLSLFQWWLGTGNRVSFVKSTAFVGQECLGAPSSVLSPAGIKPVESQLIKERHPGDF